MEYFLSKVELWWICNKDFNQPIWSQFFQISFPIILRLIQNQWAFGRSCQHEKCSKLDFLPPCKFLYFYSIPRYFNYFPKFKNRPWLSKFLIQLPSRIRRNSNVKVIHHFKFCRPVFLFQFFELWKVVFGPNQVGAVWSFKFNYIPWAPPVSPPPLFLSWPAASSAVSTLAGAGPPPPSLAELTSTDTLPLLLFSPWDASKPAPLTPPFSLCFGREAAAPPAFAPPWPHGSSPGCTAPPPSLWNRNAVVQLVGAIHRRERWIWRRRRHDFTPLVSSTCAASLLQASHPFTFPSSSWCCRDPWGRPLPAEAPSPGKNAAVHSSPALSLLTRRSGEDPTLKLCPAPSSFHARA
jgi:hypothetical protein